MQSSHPLIFAHRGASAYAPENTLASFRMAADLRADGIELDTKLSSDGVVVVMHDQTVDRTTDGKGSIGNLTSEALHHLDAGSHFSLDFKGEPVPTLEEVFEAVGSRVFINVEVTNYASPLDALPNKVAELIRQHGLVDRVIISSFHPLNLIRFNKLLPSVPLALLAQGGKAGAWARSWLGGLFPQNALHPYFSDVDAAMVDRLHRNGKKVNVWTVNDEAEICRLVDCKVDGIITDDPVLARKVL
jgi:glycerophosphoryl diester phosphodiesterase